MHRVDIKKRRTLALRYAAYAATLILSIITTVVLLYVALGYRFDQGHVVRSGLLLVDNKPEAAQIFINNELKDNSSPGRFVLSAGNYDLKLTLDGYREWSKQVAVAASGVREVNYPLLIPSKLDPAALGEISSPYLVSQSQDRKFLLLHTANQSELSLITLNTENFERTPLTLPDTLKRENGSIGTFSVVEWALDNKHVLLEQQLPSGAVELLSLDVTKPADLRNITSLYGAQSPSDVHYVGGDTDFIYGVKDGILRRYSLEEESSETILQNVRSYKPYGDDTILFDRQKSGATVEVGIWKADKTRVVHAAEGGSPSLLAYARFDDQYYFATASSESNKVHIYRNPLENPIVAKQTPFTVLEFSQPQKLSFSDSSQFLLIQNNNSYITYDFDDFKKYSVTVPFELEPNSSFSWFDSAHLQVKRADGMAFVMDYDGKNIQELLLTQAGTRLYFSNNYRNGFRILSTNNTTRFEVVPLVVE